jgi:hypothetical protein
MQSQLFRLSIAYSILIALQLQAQQRVHIAPKDGNGALPVIENATDTVVGTIPLGIMPREHLGRTKDLILNANGTLSVIDPTRGVVSTINARRAIGLLTSSTAAEKMSPTHASVVAASDGIGVLDTTTGLEWLPFSYSLGLSFELAVANPRSAIPAGYVLATDAEVLQLLRDFGFPSLSPNTIINLNENGTLANAFFALFGTTDRDYRLSVGLSKPDFTISPCDTNCMASSLSITIVYGPSVISLDRAGSALFHAPEYLGLSPSTNLAYAYFLVRRPLGGATSWVMTPSIAVTQPVELARSGATSNNPSARRAALADIGTRIEKSGLPKSIATDLLAAITAALNSLLSGDSKGMTDRLTTLQQRLTSLAPGGLTKEEANIIAKIAAQLQQLLQ